MFSKHSFLVAGLGLLVLISGCGDDIDDARSVIEVSSVAENGIYIAAMWDAGDDKAFPSADDVQPAGYVPVTLQNRSYNNLITAEPLQPYGDFVVTGVRVEWMSATGPDENLNRLRQYNTTFQYDVMIPKNVPTPFQVLVVPFALKNDPYFRDLANGYGGDGSLTPFAANAKMTFTGHDSGDERTVTFEGYAIVEFIGVIVTD